MEPIIINHTTNNPLKPCAINEIRIDLNNGLQIPENMSVGLSYLGIYYSWFNITAAFKNTLLQYIWTDGVTYNVQFPDGFYSASDMSNFMQSKMKANGHCFYDSNSNPVYFIQFYPNANYYSIVVDVAPVVLLGTYTNPNSIPLIQQNKCPQIVIPDSPIKNNLGILPGSYPTAAGTTVAYSVQSSFTPQITSITSINVECNLVNNVNSKYNEVIATFTPTVAYAKYYVREPFAPTMYASASGYKKMISLKFTDQLGDPIQIKDKVIQAELKFKLIKPIL